MYSSQTFPFSRPFCAFGWRLKPLQRLDVRKPRFVTDLHVGMCQELIAEIDSGHVQYLILAPLSYIRQPFQTAPEAESVPVSQLRRCILDKTIKVRFLNEILPAFFKSENAVQ